eukprot:14103408-Alexandrium_andersonii.AAC.1
MGAYSAESLKPTVLWSNRPRAFALTRSWACATRHITPINDGQPVTTCRTVVDKATGLEKKAVTGASGLKRTQQCTS